MGPLMRAYTGHWVITREPPRSCAGHIRRVIQTEGDAAPKARRPLCHACSMSGGEGRRRMVRTGQEVGQALREPVAGCADKPARTLECACLQLQAEQAVLLVGTGQAQSASLLGR